MFKKFIPIIVILFFCVNLFAMHPFLKKELKEFLKDKNFAVITQDGVPTASEMGPKRNSTIYKIVISIKNGGKWERKISFFSSSPDHFLKKGDIIKIHMIKFKSWGIDIQTRTLKRLPIERRGGVFQEYCRTNFNFYFDKKYLNSKSEESLNFIKKSINNYLKLFKTFEEAEAFVNKSKPAPELKIGTSEDDVIKALGMPKAKIKIGDKIIYKYDDMKIIIKDGKVIEIKI